MSDFRFARPEESLGFLLWQATTVWQRLIKDKLTDVSQIQFVLLAVLAWYKKQGQQPTQAALAALAKLEVMTVSKALRALHERGLITRTEHAKDPRAYAVGLTLKGVTLMKKLIPLVEEVDAGFFERLTQEEQRVLLSLLKKLAF